MVARHKPKARKQPIPSKLPKLAKTQPGLVDSEKQKLNIGEIVRKAALYTKSEYPPDVVAVIIAKELSIPGAHHLQIGNTMFIFHEVPDSPRVVWGRALNADTANRYTQNAIKFSTWLYNKGYDTFVTEFSDPKLMQLFRFLVRQAPQQEMGYKALQLPDGTIRAIVKLGPARE